jgi:hypothetical protein
MNIINSEGKDMTSNYQLLRKIQSDLQSSVYDLHFYAEGCNFEYDLRWQYIYYTSHYLFDAHAKYQVMMKELYSIKAPEEKRPFMVNKYAIKIVYPCLKTALDQFKIFLLRLEHQQQIEESTLNDYEYETLISIFRRLVFCRDSVLYILKLRFPDNDEDWFDTTR